MKLPVFNFGVKRGQGQKPLPIILVEYPASPAPGDPSSANKARFQREMNLQLAIHKIGLPVVSHQTESEKKDPR